MDSNTMATVNTTVRNIQRTYGIEISDQAAMILGECFTAVLNDPHESWPTNLNLSSFQTDMVNALPAMLVALAADLRLTRLTSFDILHNMSRMVDQGCPFRKPPP